MIAAPLPVLLGGRKCPVQRKYVHMRKSIVMLPSELLDEPHVIGGRKSKRGQLPILALRTRNRQALNLKWTWRSVQGVPAGLCLLVIRVVTINRPRDDVTRVQTGFAT